MVMLKNVGEIFEHEVCFESFLKNKETDCILHSKEGRQFNVHKEIFYQTKLMRDILVNANDICCRIIEILVPCSEDELESIVNFLYTGTISFKEEKYIVKILDHLTNIFGFSEELFSIEDRLMLKQGK